jgi:hypothetical protein
VNSLIACQLSGNAEAASLFKDRAIKFMESHPPKDDEAVYYALAHQYLSRDDE